MDRSVVCKTMWSFSCAAFSLVFGTIYVTGADDNLNFNVQSQLFFVAGANIISAADSKAMYNHKHPVTSSETYNTTCAKLGCVYNREASCACNWACYKYSDCCSDFNAVCNSSHHHPSPAPPPNGPTGGPEQLHLSMTNDYPRKVKIMALNVLLSCHAII